ncbi:unnamed protein product [Closterium sp. Naga37s-1]|nr:unnamed protein product [Closterium sp. Naga37s-1]
MASLLPSLIPPLFLQPKPPPLFSHSPSSAPRPDKVAPSQARHVSPNVGTPPHPPLDSRTAEAELALADVTSADMAFLADWKALFVQRSEEERVCFLPRPALSLASPPSLAPCSPAPSPSDVSPSCFIATPCTTLHCSDAIPITSPPDPPVPSLSTPFLYRPLFPYTPAPAPTLLRSQWPTASSRYCYRSFLLGGEKREGVVGCG